jgi:hypothetical protein
MHADKKETEKPPCWPVHGGLFITYQDFTEGTGLLS